MIGLVTRSSRSIPWSGSVTATGVPFTLGAGVGITVGRGVPGIVSCGATARGVAVGGGTVGRGVSRFAGLDRVGVGAGGGDVPKPHAEASDARMRIAQRRCITSRSPWGKYTAQRVR
jgi:hypothetical protein